MYLPLVASHGPRGAACRGAPQQEGLDEVIDGERHGPVALGPFAIGNPAEGDAVFVERDQLAVQMAIRWV